MWNLSATTESPKGPARKRRLSATSGMVALMMAAPLENNMDMTLLLVLSILGTIALAPRWL